MKTNKKNELKKLFLWELVLGVLLTISVVYFPSKVSLKEILNANDVGLLVYKALQLYCLACIIFLVTANTTIRAKMRSMKKAFFIASMQLIHRPYIVWIIRGISIPIFTFCAMSIFMGPKPCDTTFIDSPIKLIWGNKYYKRWHNHCLNVHYSIVYACS